MVQTRLSVFTRRCGRLRIRLRRERSRRSYVSRMARKSSPKMVGEITLSPSSMLDKKAVLQASLIRNREVLEELAKH